MIDHIILLKCSAAAFMCTLFCTWLLRPLATHIGLVDQPGGRKWHEKDVPLIGGIAMFFGFGFALLLLPFPMHQYRGLVAGSGLLILMGVVDDFRELGSKLRLAGQMLACLFLIIWGHLLVENLGNLLFLGDIHINRWAFPLTTIAVLGYINSMNMIDGQDGLAGGIALSQTLLLLFLNTLIGNTNNIIFLIILGVLLTTFLLFNMPLPWRKKADVFLGDAGSTFIAFVIAWFATDLAQNPTAEIKPITILWILSMPLFDLISVCAYRIYKGVSPFTAGRDHLHHILHMRGVNTTISTFLMCLLSVIFGMIGILLTLRQVAEGWLFVGYLAALAFYLLFVKVVRERQNH